MCTLIPEQVRGRLCPMAGGGFTIALGQQCQLSPEYVLGLLNSKLLFWRLRGMSNVFRGGWITCTKQYFGELPIRVLDRENEGERALHDRMVDRVRARLTLERQLASAASSGQRDVIQRQIGATEASIDQLTYEIYGMTADEIALVEGSVADGA